MPVYQMRCKACEATKDVKLTFTEFGKVSQGEMSVPCAECEGALVVEFAPGSVGFILKEGESGGWASKANRENLYRKHRSQVMAKKTQDHVFTPSLQPNYKGEETGSWKEAQEAARQDKGELAAASYTSLVE